MSAQSRWKTGKDVPMRAQSEKPFVASSKYFDPVGGMNKLCFYRGNKNNVLFALKYIYTYFTT